MTISPAYARSGTTSRAPHASESARPFQARRLPEDAIGYQGTSGALDSKATFLLLLGTVMIAKPVQSSELVTVVGSLAARRD